MAISGRRGGSVATASALLVAAPLPLVVAAAARPAARSSSSPLGAPAMPTINEGALVTCDAAMKTLIKHLDEGGKQGIVIKDLDATHLLVKKDKVEFIMRKVDELMDKNTFAPVGEEQLQQKPPPAKRAKQAKTPPG